MTEKFVTIGLTEQHFTTKPQGKQVGSLAFTVTTLSVHELLSKLAQGYCIAHVFGHGNTFTMKEKNNANFTSASFVSVDVDDSSVDMYTYIQGLIHKPSIAYTTFSNQVEGKGYRFRLIYVLSDKVTTVERYKDCYEYFTNGLNLKDNCMQSVAQFIIGTSQNAETYTSDEVYSVEDIPTLRHSNSIIKEMRHSNSIIKEAVKIDEAFLADFYTMKYSDFLMKYKEVYPFFTSTPLPTVSEDVPYILLPSDYIEIKRYWCVDKVINDNGEVERTYYNRVRRLKDGQGRRKKLYINAILRRMMVEDITVEYLITMLANELYYYVNNSVDKITKQDIVTIASNAIRADLKEFNSLRVQKHSTFVVNPSYCFKYGCNKKSASNIAKKMILRDMIGELYDCSKTDKENLKVMEENGVKVSRMSLYRFKQEQGLTKNVSTKSYNKKEQIHYTVGMIHSNEDNTMYQPKLIIKEKNVSTETYNKKEQEHYTVRLVQTEEDKPMCNSNSIKKEMYQPNLIKKEDNIHYTVGLIHSDNKKEETVQTQPKEDAKMTEEEMKEKRMKTKALIEELLRRYELISDSEAIIQKYPIVMEYIRGKREYLTQAESASYLFKANQLTTFRIRR